jgi:hypothetical protein
MFPISFPFYFGHFPKCPLYPVSIAHKGFSHRVSNSNTYSLLATGVQKPLGSFSQLSTYLRQFAFSFLDVQWFCSCQLKREENFFKCSEFFPNYGLSIFTTFSHMQTDVTVHLSALLLTHVKRACRLSENLKLSTFNYS